MRKETGNTSIYIRDKNLYLKRVSSIREKWYSLYMQHLTTSDILLKGLELLDSSLQKEEIEVVDVNQRKISDKYSRVGE